MGHNQYVNNKHEVIIYIRNIQYNKDINSLKELALDFTERQKICKKNF